MKKQIRCETCSEIVGELYTFKDTDKLPDHLICVCQSCLDDEQTETSDGRADYYYDLKNDR